MAIFKKKKEKNSCFLGATTSTLTLFVYKGLLYALII